MTRYAALVLAAGLGARFKAAGGLEATKLVALHRGEPLVRHVVRAALASAADPVIVVTGHAHAAVEAALDGLDAVLVHNSGFAEGMSATLRCGLAVLPSETAGIVVLLGDMPDIAASVVDRLIERAKCLKEVDAVVPIHADRRGNPVLLCRSLFARLVELTGDQGARTLLADPATHVAEIDGPPSILVDVDHPADVRSQVERL